MHRHLIHAAALLALSAATPPCPAAEAPLVEPFLIRGDLAGAEAAAADALKNNPKDDQARFGLGVTRFLRAVEGRIQAFHRHGLQDGAIGGFMGLTNLPVPPKPRPEPIDAAKARLLLQTWVDDLAGVEATLAGVTSPDVKLPLHFGRIRLDFDGDGNSSDAETLWKVYGRFNRGADLDPESAEGFVVTFDRGDVDWLRGYCHLLSALTEFLLGHDFDGWFRESGHLFFRGAAVPHRFIAEEAAAGRGLDYATFADLVAAVHQVRLPVSDPKRLAAVLTHLEATVALSRSSWEAILAEKDDDHEWVPNPSQTSVLGGARVTREMVQGWSSFLDEFGAILAGRKLVPFWRGVSPTRGLNLRRALTEPRTFDLVLWAQGGAAAPYLEEGVVSTPETWGRINRIFRGEFIGFALWFN